MIQMAIFASGTGSNAERIIRHFTNNPNMAVGLVVCNKPGAGVIDIADRHKIPVLIIEKEAFFRGDAYVAELKANGIGFIVLAGFLWKIPPALVAAYPDKIINIHPALLPKFGGKGMYGHFVHEAVIAAGEKESGITIHLVDEVYDHGQPLFQASCSIDETDTPATVAQKIQVLEHQHYPAIIEKAVLQAYAMV